MPDGYELLASELDSHASHLDEVADKLRTARDAAVSVSLPTEAYGLICQFFPPLLSPIEKTGLDALTEAVEALEGNARDIRDSARNYRDQEDSAAAMFKGIL